MIFCKASNRLVCAVIVAVMTRDKWFALFAKTDQIVSKVGQYRKRQPAQGASIYKLSARLGGLCRVIEVGAWVSKGNKPTSVFIKISEFVSKMSA